jgi:V/A-type H+-transporting ATPase subunit D
MAIRVPPGRGGRIWLRDRLAVADRAADLLEEKRRALMAESQRLRHLAVGTQDRWLAACREAETWALRADVMGGQRQLDRCAGRTVPRADLGVQWRSLMGLAYPAEADVKLPPAPDVDACAETSALTFSVEAHRAAVQAAVHHAAAQRALDLVDREIEVTTRRSRAISHRWIPRLETRLTDLERRLDERERQEAVRARWSRDRLAATEST